MEVFKEITPLQHYLHQNKSLGKSVGLVPTMGALHEGHLSLLKASLMENELTICSIYVNPVQFNNAQDLEKYPRVLEQDLQLLQDAGCDVVFCPSDNIMYPAAPKISFEFNGLDKVMEGKFRPGHFSGVGLIVCKLFNMITPHRAYFGQKDLQQYLIIKKIVQDLSYPIVVRCMPIIREDSGLAMSSRNKRLSEKGLEKAGALYQALKTAEQSLRENKSISDVKDNAFNFLTERGVIPDYFEVVDPDTLELKENNFFQKNVALCVAGFVEEVRLIDNIIINFGDQ